MADPTPLRALKREPTADIVETLERLLAGAKSGEIVGVAFAAEMTEGRTLTAWAHGPETDFGKLVHALERTKLRILLRHGVDEV